MLINIKMTQVFFLFNCIFPHLAIVIFGLLIFIQFWIFVRLEFDILKIITNFRGNNIFWSKKNDDHDKIVLTNKGSDDDDFYWWFRMFIYFVIACIAVGLAYWLYNDYKKSIEIFLFISQVDQLVSINLAFRDYMSFQEFREALDNSIRLTNLLENDQIPEILPENVNFQVIIASQNLVGLLEELNSYTGLSSEQVAKILYAYDKTTKSFSKAIYVIELLDVPRA